jgi:deoxyribodipyrimidine photo-lyase
MYSRIRQLNDADLSGEGDFVLYWMTAFRRTTWNYALDRAVGLGREMGKPLVVLEALRADYQWASARFHQFVIQGMVDNSDRFRRARIAYFPYVEPTVGAGKGLLGALASQASAIVTDDFPGFFYPRMLAAAARRVGVRLEAVDSNGLLPMRSSTKAFTAAYHFRRYLHQELPNHFDSFPESDPLAAHGLPTKDPIPAEIRKRWPEANLGMLTGRPVAEALHMVDGSVGPTDTKGGEEAGRRRLEGFLEGHLHAYGERRNDPDSDGTSGLSPYLHFGHISVHEIADAVLRFVDWTPDRVEPGARGRREGWWGVSPSVESFLDELVTWREVGFNAAVHLPDYERYESLPDWARRTLAEHEGDPRDSLYSLEEFERAATHDALWNAAQRQLVREGRIHGYLRMLWGKKILEWTPSPEEALHVMVELNNKYALDGRDPNSYSGIFWVLGRYDRPWGPERPIFGKIRYMTSKNTARKVAVREYLDRYGQ